MLYSGLCFAAVASRQAYDTDQHTYVVKQGKVSTWTTKYLYSPPGKLLPLFYLGSEAQAPRAIWPRPMHKESSVALLDFYDIQIPDLDSTVSFQASFSLATGFLGLRENAKPPQSRAPPFLNIPPLSNSDT
ncbi:uncharacterized protein MYCFIDRAFT_169816 [Pseudocercospora fijiensis CIRAD86]|uniref:Uncharacterized protein n=1 Tax=Pseudocercospora fijiensis (strain CIRAD86) TaxID=383855 RepID=N1QAT5_PSEFD|nr:uncharacterized protein MYCFIDRAFT_169816 [Pseudocercospora fijiensis CIRAD86]EME88132.1 hypothetical protein MYCFIDRAFT_169816 [Pseudocercospora fijiensis CIRAD86]